MLKSLSLESTSVSHGALTPGMSYIHNRSFVFCLFRTQLVPYNPTTRTAARTTTVSTTSQPKNHLEYLEHLEDLEDDFEYYERMRSAAEEEFVQNGPTHLLEALYCDPCSGKVMDMCQKYIHP